VSVALNGVIQLKLQKRVVRTAPDRSGEAALMHTRRPSFSPLPYSNSSAGPEAATADSGNKKAAALVARRLDRVPIAAVSTDPA
jgi:hypothetical protein